MRGRLRTGPLMFVIACLVANAGCGGGDDGPGASQSPATPAASQAPKAPEAVAVADLVIETVTSAIDGEDCAPARRINLRSTYKFVCPPPAAPSFRGFEVLDSARYGTGAVIDYRTRRSPDGASMVMFQAEDGNWAVGRFGLLTDGGSVPTSDEDSREQADRVVSRYMEAVRTRDCDSYVDIVVIEASDERAFCRAAMKGENPAVRAIRSDPSKRPRYLGGNRYFGFYGIDVGKGSGYLTVVTAKTPDGSLEPSVILNAHPGPPAEDRQPEASG